jgi:hypothetical protein
MYNHQKKPSNIINYNDIYLNKSVIYLWAIITAYNLEKKKKKKKKIFLKKKHSFLQKQKRKLQEFNTKLS